MLSFVTLALFTSSAFDWFFKGLLIPSVGIELINRRLGFGPREGVLTPMVTPGFHLVSQSTETMGQDIAKIGGMFEELQPFQGMRLFITESEAAQLRALLDPVISAMHSALECTTPNDLIKHHNQAKLSVTALAIWLSRMSDQRLK